MMLIRKIRNTTKYSRWFAVFPSYLYTTADGINVFAWLEWIYHLEVVDEFGTWKEVRRASGKEYRRWKKWMARQKQLLKENKPLEKEPNFEDEETYYNEEISHSCGCSTRNH